MNISTGSHSDIENCQAVGLSIPEASLLSGIGRTTLYAAIKSGALVARKCGKRTIILRSDLITWLNALPLSVTTSDSSDGHRCPHRVEDGHGQA
jgi:excisionase family DNA binding protein